MSRRKGTGILHKGAGKDSVRGIGGEIFYSLNTNIFPFALFVFFINIPFCLVRELGWLTAV